MFSPRNKVFLSLLALTFKISFIIFLQSFICAMDVNKKCRSNTSCPRNISCDKYYGFLFVAEVYEEQGQWGTYAERLGIYLENLFNLNTPFLV
jgi:hypothetical protein